MAAFALIGCEYCASSNKVINSFNVLVTQVNFGVCNIMQGISLVVAYKWVVIMCRKGKHFSFTLTFWIFYLLVRIDFCRHEYFFLCGRNSLRRRFCLSFFFFFFFVVSVLLQIAVVVSNSALFSRVYKILLHIFRLLLIQN